MSSHPAMSLGDRLCASRKGGAGEVGLKGANSMAASGLSFEQPKGANSMAASGFSYPQKPLKLHTIVIVMLGTRQFSQP